MEDRNLKLIKSNLENKATSEEKSVEEASSIYPEYLTLVPKPIELTPEEVSELERFRSRTATRAAHKFMVHCIMRELEALDEFSSAA